MTLEEQLIELEETERQRILAAVLIMFSSITNLKGRLETQLRDFYQKYGSDGIVTYAEARKWVSIKNHRRRLNVLLEWIGENFDSLNLPLSENFKEMLLKIIDYETTFFENKVDKEKILTESWDADDRNWSDRLQDDVAIWAFYIMQDVKQNILQRRTIDDLLKKMDKRFSSMSKVLENLSLSEGTAIGSMARRELFKQMGISKYKFYTEHDGRECETCGSLHGMIFPMTSFEIGVTASPIHKRCRCWEVPIVD